MIYPVIEDLAYDGHTFYGCFEGEPGRGREIETIFREVQDERQTAYHTYCMDWHKKRKENGGVNKDP